MDRATVSVGYTRSDLAHYRVWRSPAVEGADITATDGQGNIIKVAVRADGIGYRVSLNGEDIAEGSTKPQRQ